MPNGRIARLLIEQGVGFTRDEGGIEHFFHRSSVRGAVFELLREGQRVEFTPEDSGKGPRAGDVRRIETGGSSASGPRPAATAGPDSRLHAEGVERSRKVAEIFQRGVCTAVP